MPTFQYDRHTLHCALGSTSSSSHSSVFPAALITSCDSLLKGLNCRCCWRSLWSACRWGWFSIFWIKFRTLTPCERFTVECGTPGMLKSMFSSSVALLNSLFALNDAMSRCFCGNQLFFHYVCVCARFHRFPCSIVSMLNTNVFRQSLKFPRSIWRTKFFVRTLFIDLVGTGSFTFITKTCSVSSGFPIDHRLVWVWIGLVWRI